MKKHKLRILYYAGQPKESNLRSFMAPKGHYEIWNEMLPRDHVDWIRDVVAGLCAIQYNIDVSTDKIVSVNNSMIKLSCLFLAWSANDPVSQSKITKHLSNRIRFYEVMDNDTFVNDRVGFPISEFENLEDYISKAWSQPIFEILRDRKPLYCLDNSISMWEFIGEGKHTFMDLDGNRHECEIEFQDISLGLYFYWMHSRIKIFFDDKFSVSEITDAVRSGNVRTVLRNERGGSFVEIRPISMGREDELFAWGALFVGLIENHSELEKMVSDWEISELKDFMGVIQEDGLESVWRGRALREWGDDVLKIAKKGLAKDNPELIEWLDPLKKILNTRSNHVTEVKRIFSEKGMDELINFLTVR